MADARFMDTLRPGAASSTVWLASVLLRRTLDMESMADKKDLLTERSYRDIPTMFILSYGFIVYIIINTR